MDDISPIGTVRGGRAEIVDDHWGGVRSAIELTDAFGPEALFGLEAFSHIEVIFQFDQVPASKIETGARRPRGNPDWPLVGIFAQRGKNRPNRIGLCTCRVVSVEGTRIEVEGLDAVDGTPVLDIKPAMSAFLPRGEMREPDWARDLMKNYW